MQGVPTYLQLSQGETTTGTDTAVVLDGRASHNGSELVDGAGSDGGSLGLTGISAGDLLAGLYVVHFVRSSSKFFAVWSAIDAGRVCSPSRPSLRVGMCSRKSYLVEVGSDPTLPILAEVWRKEVSICDAQRTSSRLRVPAESDRGMDTKKKGRKLTVLDNGLVVLDRLYEKSKGQ